MNPPAGKTPAGKTPAGKTPAGKTPAGPPASGTPASGTATPGTPESDAATPATATSATATPPRDPRDELPDHLPALRAFAVSLTRNAAAADDLVQDTIIKAWTNFDKFETGTNLRAWLFRILRNTFYSHARKHRREVADPEGIHAGRLFVKPDHDGKLAFAEFLVAFDQLSPEHREALVLVGASGYSYAEAAEMMGVAVGTVKSRTNRARARLCDLLGLQEGEDPIAQPGREMLGALGHIGENAA